MIIMQTKRMHPMKIAFSIFSLLRNSIFFAFYLFILKFNNDAMFYKMARIALVIIIICSIIAIIIEWLNTTYEIKEGFIYIYSGMFMKKHNSLALQHVQDVQWHTPYFYKKFQLTTLTFEASAMDTAATVKLKPIKKEEADYIAQQLDNRREIAPKMEQFPEETAAAGSIIEDSESQTIHFRPTRKDLWKASFLSFRFFAIIPVLAFVYRGIDDIVNIDNKVKGTVNYLTHSWLLILLATSIFVIIAVAYGVIQTFLKYSKYEIASDSERIFIRNGIFDKTEFSIRKERVQGVQIMQTPLKKLLGIAEIKLVSGTEDEDDEVSSLYPFLPNDQAYELIEALLPAFEIKQNMQKLTRLSLLYKMLRLPWISIIATAFIVWLKPEWWYISLVLFSFTYLLRFFDYRNTKFLLNNQFIQFKTGGLWSELFVTNRKKVIEVAVKQSFLQKKFGLATIETVNRAKPVTHKQLKDITFAKSQQFLAWYQERYRDIEIDRK